MQHRKNVGAENEGPYGYHARNVVLMLCILRCILCDQLFSAGDGN